MNEKIPNSSTFFMRDDQYDAVSSKHKRTHCHSKCKIKGCEAPSFLDGLCPFHYDLICKKEIRHLLRESTCLLNVISHQLPLATFQIISPANIPKNCQFFNNKQNYPNYPVPLNNIDDSIKFDDDFFTDHDSIFSEFEKNQYFNSCINHSFTHNMCFPTIIPPCQNYLRYNKSPVCIGERCQFYKIESEELNE